MDELVIIGVVIVGFISFARFNQVPPPFHYWCKRDSLVESVLAWVKIESPKHFVFPPPRANTTPVKYWLSRAAYTLIGIGIYLAILEIPGLSEQVQAIVQARFMQGDSENLTEMVHALLSAGPVTAAFVIAVILPMLPLFKTADLYIRSALYDRASIPAQRFREVWRLKEADYVVSPEALRRVTNSLTVEGFNPVDIKYDSNAPTTASLWTKIALLMRHSMVWAADDRYKTAFATLMDAEENVLAFHQLQTRYDVLKSDAKVCLREISQPGTEASIAREDVFRKNCKALLLYIYDFLSRVSLHSHYSEDERIKNMREIGFILKDKDPVPLPDANDLIMLVVVLSGVLIIPLALLLNISKAAIIGAIVYSAILLPIYIANHFPALAGRRGHRGMPDLFFPLVSALSAMLVGFVVIMTYRFFELDMSISAAWEVYTKKYPWSFIHGVMAFMIALRMRIGHYPDVGSLTARERYRAWGDLRDGFIILFVAEAVLILLVLPLLTAANSAPNNIVGALVVLGMMSFTIGFIVPTWYRARVMLHQVDRRASASDRHKYRYEYDHQLGMG